MKAALSVVEGRSLGHAMGLLSERRNPAKLYVAGGTAYKQASLPGTGEAVLPRVQACSAEHRSPRAAGIRGLVEAREREEALKPELAFYRKYTEGMLRRYQTLSMESGRVPSMLGRELFKGRASSYKVRAFDDVVIFCHDIGRCLEQLPDQDQRLIRRIALQEYTQQETSELLGIGLSTVVRRYSRALDELTAIFLQRGLLEPLAGCSAALEETVPKKPVVRESEERAGGRIRTRLERCQGGKRAGTA